jgi:hypothetical protein
MDGSQVLGFDEFDAAVLALGGMSQALDSTLIEGSEVPGIVRFRVAIGASDIVAFCPIFRESLVAVTADSAQETLHAHSWPRLDVPHLERAEEFFEWNRARASALDV